MTEKPIIFSAPMVRAILAGRKTQTRRLLRYQTTFAGKVLLTLGKLLYMAELRPKDGPLFVRPSPYAAGDHLWVKETHGFLTGNGIRVVYRADADPPIRSDGSPVEGMRWKPSIFMRREHSRITLEVTAVRVERLQEITMQDVIAEGAIERDHRNTYVSAFDGKAYLDLQSLWVAGWDSINGKRAAWASNPWVAVVSFKNGLM